MNNNYEKALGWKPSSKKRLEDLGTAYELISQLMDWVEAVDERYYSSDLIARCDDFIKMLDGEE